MTHVRAGFRETSRLCRRLVFYACATALLFDLVGTVADAMSMPMKQTSATSTEMYVTKEASDGSHMQIKQGPSRRQLAHRMWWAS